MSWRTQVWLTRHGEIGSYRGDNGLTERGLAQAQAAGAELAEELGGGPVELRHADSARAGETTRAVGAVLAERGVAVSEPRVDRGFDNFYCEVDGVVHRHDQMRVSIYEQRALADWRPAHPATWVHEADRFATIHDSDGDPITWWLTQPVLAYEPAARVVRRFWAALAQLAADGVERAVVGTHSGPMRALAAHALGHDPGEPEHLEHVVVRLAGDAPGAPAEVTYRGATVALAIPRTEEPAWP